MGVSVGRPPVVLVARPSVPSPRVDREDTTHRDPLREGRRPGVEGEDGLPTPAPSHSGHLGLGDRWTRSPCGLGADGQTSERTEDPGRPRSRTEIVTLESVSLPRPFWETSGRTRDSGRAISVPLEIEKRCVWVHRPCRSKDVTPLRPPEPTGVQPSVSARSFVPAVLGPQTGPCRLSSDASDR